ncbi:MAG TPA: ABC transporter ATP-binding protein [Natronoarchaeum rubrum]|nr:ABC transporter ATP-binding protein [Natronoarchaeum rubrum]
MIRTTGLTKQFGGLTAVDGVDFELGENELCSLIGPNGAGKTTFFNLLTGSLSPTEGRVELRETETRDEGDTGSPGGAEWVDVTDAEPHETALGGLHRSYQISNLFPTATALENVRVAAQAHGGADAWKLWRNVSAFDEYEREARAILERVGLAEEADTTAETLSHGQKRHLEVAVALAGDPDVLLLDEPTAGVSSDAIDQLVELIRSVAADHAVLLVEHNMDVVMDVSDRVAVLHQGSLIADGPPEAVREDPAVQEAYLGGYEPGADAAGDTDPSDGDTTDADDAADAGPDSDAGGEAA